MIWQGGCPIVAEPSHAVFLSYASQDSEAAQKIAEALRAGGIEIFLDQSELRGGDAWDKKIRHEIRDWVLFIPIVSKHTQERLEGYFRHEWNLAIERTHHMAENKAFLVPVVVDGTPEHDPSIPENSGSCSGRPIGRSHCLLVRKLKDIRVLSALKAYPQKGNQEYANAEKSG